MRVELREVARRTFTGADLEMILILPDKTLRELVDLHRTYRLQVNRHGLQHVHVCESRKNFYFFLGGVSSSLELHFSKLRNTISRLEVHELSENRRVMPNL